MKRRPVSEGDSASRTLPENSAANVNIGAAISATDPEEGTLTYELTGTDAASFRIDSNGQLSTKAGVTYDYESQPSYAFTVTVSDGANSVSLPVTVSLTDVNDAPVFSAATYAFSVSEDAAVLAFVGTALATDPDAGDSATHAITAGNTGGVFIIGEYSGIIAVRHGLDHETTPTYTLTVTATDTGSPALSASATVTITVTDVNEPPVFTDGASATRSLPENSAANVNVGDPISATDPEEGALTYTLTGTDAASFTIDSATGQLSTATGVDYDYEATQNTYSLTVTATEDGDTSLATSIPVTINLTNVNEPPVFSAETFEFSVSENASRFTTVGTAAAVDPDEGESLAFSITAGNTGGKLAIVRNTGDIVVSSPLNFVTTSAYTLSVKVIEDGNPAHSDTATVTINVFSAIDRYRQVRTWTGRNLANDADVTLTTYGTWSTSSTPPNAPAITSKTTTETRDDDDKVRKTITWTDGTNNKAYQRTEWYTPQYQQTQYREQKNWSDGLGITRGAWTTNSNPSGAPNVGNSNWFDYRDNGGAGGTWTWEEKIIVTWRNPQTGESTEIHGNWVDRGGTHPTDDPPAPPGTSGSRASHEPSYTREIEPHQVTRITTPVYAPSSGPTENLPARTESAPRE